ncbi:MAG: phosphoribosylglycinamide formyltransferase [Oscillospiraceae bacterium]|nr:phosphoribosylglycinamide formyltransferase [Oscillospiraceae bacterium]
MLKVKTAVLVSGGGTNLQALIDASARGELPDAELVLVVSDRRNAFALERAKKSGIRAEHIGPDGFEQKLEALLDECGVELIVLAGFLKILSADFTEKRPRRIINVHPSLIPSFCGEGFYGLRVHEEALKYGVKVTGATVHFVNHIPDGGEIIFQKAVDVLDGDTPETLQRRVMEQAEWILLPKAVEKTAKEICHGKSG